MELKNIFQVTAICAAVTLTGCGGDLKIEPTINDNSVTDSNNTTNNPPPTPTPPGDENPCATRGDLQGAWDGLDCTYTNSFAGRNVEFTEDVTFAELPDGGVHLLFGALQIGEDCNTETGCSINQNGPTLNVEPGATLAFTSDENIIRIARGATINAVGTAEKPITFTSANAIPRHDVVGLGPQFADWGGIVINGFGITNQCTDAQRTEGTCNKESEGIASHFGGNNNADSSGNIKFAKIWYAGSGPKVGGEGDDLNSLTLNAVGSGSSFDYIHVHQGFDDGIEFFGGAATISHIVVTETQDDGIDIDAGWQGKGQFIYVKHGSVESKKDVSFFNDDGELVTIEAGTEGGMGNNGFETDGIKDGPASAQAPASNPVIANVTVVTTNLASIRDADDSQAIKFDDEIQGAYYNTLLIKADSTNETKCIEFKSDAVDAADNGTLTLSNSVMACGGNDFKDDSDLASQSKVNWFINGGVSEILASSDVSVLSADGFSTNSSSNDISVTAKDLSELNDSFFVAADYIGAVSDQDTDSVWYQWVQAALEAADQD